METYWEAFMHDCPPLIGESTLAYLERFYYYLHDKWGFRPGTYRHTTNTLAKPTDGAAAEYPREEPA